MFKLILSFSIIALGISTGYLIQTQVNRGKLNLGIELADLRIRLQKIALLFFMPVTILLAIWIVEIRSVSLAALPFICLGALLLGGFSALLVAKMMGMENRQAGSFFAAGSFTNIGSIGALVCFLYLGEVGFALVPIYKLFEELTYYSVGFPICKFLSTSEKDSESSLTRLKGLVKDPFIQAAVSSIIIGAVLNFADVPRPAFFGTVNAIFIPVGTSLLLISIGLALKFRSVIDFLKEGISLSFIKFGLVPVTMSLIAYSIGFGEIEDGLPLKVVIILTSMPVAFNALIPPSIYDLDLDLANACWFFSTASLIAVLPILSFVIGLV